MSDAYVQIGIDTDGPIKKYPGKYDCFREVDSEPIFQVSFFGEGKREKSDCSNNKEYQKWNWLF